MVSSRCEANVSGYSLSHCEESHRGINLYIRILLCQQHARLYKPPRFGALSSETFI
jgi:hypothetical protein